MARTTIPIELSSTPSIVDGGNATAITINASENVGIGTSPDFRLHVSGTGVVLGLNATSGAVSQRFNENGTARFFLSTLNGSNGLAFVNGDGTSERMRIDSSGNVGIGTTIPHGKLTISNGVNGTEASPQFAIAGAASTYILSFFLDATAAYIGQNSAIRNLRLYSGAESAGVNLANGGTSWGTFSDERLKENIQDIGSVIEKIKDIRCVTYTRKDLENAQETIGFIAQDFIGKFDQVLDELKVSDSDEETRYSIKYTETIPVLLKAIQEQQTLIESLTARITTLEG
jgi:hypothetical protein